MQEYGDAWLDLLERALAEVGTLSSTSARVLPSVMRFDDREVVGRSNVFSGYGSGNMYLALHEWTGDEKYFLPEKTWLDREMMDYPLLVDWVERVDFSPYREWLLGAADEVSYEDLRPGMGNDKRTQIQFAAWKLGGPRELIVEALRASWERIELLFPMHTWAEQSADRVWISKDLVDRLYLGGTPGYRNHIYPTHSVTWEGFSPDFAAWVLETTAEKLRVMAYNFEQEPQTGSIRVWRLKPGMYRVAVGPDANEDGMPDEATSEGEMELAKTSAIEITLPSRETTAISIELIASSGEHYYGRCDLALAPQDTVISEDASEVTVRVHNVGGGDAPEFTVTLLGERGDVVASENAGPLRAPADCLPQIVELKFAVPDGRRGEPFTVVVDSKNAIRELYEGNNRVELPAG